MTQRLEGTTPDGGPPDFDGPSVARVASRVELDTIELLALNLSQPTEAVDAEESDEGAWGIGAAWIFEAPDQEEEARLEAKFAFTWTLGTRDEGYELFAEYRLRYVVIRHEELKEEDLSQFVHWNAVFNVWPYWRELLTNITSRTEVGPVVAPVFKMPAAKPEETST